MRPRVIQIRRDICARNKCDAVPAFDDPCASCPNGHWGAHIRKGCDDPNREIPLGDRIERIAKPIARVIDKITGSKIAGCGGCKRMKDRLNAGMSLSEAIKLRVTGK